MPIKIFISYSRRDGPFVDRLQADLQARGFDAWVDRRRLEGGQDWQDMIEEAINRSNVVLIVLSPDSIESPWVRREIGYAQDSNKHLVPLKLKAITQVPIRLNGIQWVDFERRYSKALSELLVILSSPDFLQEQQTTIVPAQMNKDDEQANELVIPRPGPPPPDPDLNSLYKAGVEARASGDIERAAILWRQVIERDSNFGNGVVQTQLPSPEELERVRIQRLQEQIRIGSENGEWRQVVGAWQAILAEHPTDNYAVQGLQVALRNLAKKASREGEWGEEIGSWEALLKMLPTDQEGLEKMPIAEQNQQWAWMYANANEFAQKREFAAASDALTTLWTRARFYGDPAGIASIVQIAVPPTYEEMYAQRIAQWTAQQEREKFAWETYRMQLYRKLTRARIGKYALYGFAIGSLVGIVFGILLLLFGLTTPIPDSSTGKPLSSQDLISSLAFGTICIFIPLIGGVGAGIGALVGNFSGKAVIAMRMQQLLQSSQSKETTS